MSKAHSVYNAYILGILTFDQKKMIEQLVFVAYLTLYIYLYYTLSLSDGLLFTAAARKKRDNDDHDVFQPCMIKIRKRKLHNLY